MEFTFYKLALLWKGLACTIGASQWRVYWIYWTNFRNSMLEGNLSQVVVINNELPNPIQLNIETLSRHEIKSTCKFNLSVVSWKVKLWSKVKRLRDKIDISQCDLLNMTVKAITAPETSLHICLYIRVYTNEILNSYAKAFKMKLFTKTFSHTFESIHCMSMPFDLHWVYHKTR